MRRFLHVAPDRPVIKIDVGVIEFCRVDQLTYEEMESERDRLARELYETQCVLDEANARGALARYAQLMHADLTMAVMLMETQLVTCARDAMRWVLSPGSPPRSDSPEYVPCSGCRQRVELIAQIHKHLALIEAERASGPTVDTAREIPGTRGGFSCSSVT